MTRLLHGLLDNHCFLDRDGLFDDNRLFDWDGNGLFYDDGFLDNSRRCCGLRSTAASRQAGGGQASTGEGDAAQKSPPARLLYRHGFLLMRTDGA